MYFYHDYFIRGGSFCPSIGIIAKSYDFYMNRLIYISDNGYSCYEKSHLHTHVNSNALLKKTSTYPS